VTCGCAVLFRCFCARPAGGRGIFVRIFRVFPIPTGKNCFSTAAKIRCRRTRTRTGTQWYTQTYALYLFICGYLSGVVGRVSKIWAATFRSSFAPVLKSSSVIPSPMLRWNIPLLFYLKKIGILSGWVRGNPPPQHQKWTDESSVSCVKDGREGGSKAIFKRKFTVCVPTMK